MGCRDIQYVCIYTRLLFDSTTLWCFPPRSSTSRSHPALFTKMSSSWRVVLALMCLANVLVAPTLANGGDRDGGSGGDGGDGGDGGSGGGSSGDFINASSSVGGTILNYNPFYSFFNAQQSSHHSGASIEDSGNGTGTGTGTGSGEGNGTGRGSGIGSGNGSGSAGALGLGLGLGEGGDSESDSRSRGEGGDSRCDGCGSVIVPTIVESSGGKPSGPPKRSGNRRLGGGGL